MMQKRSLRATWCRTLRPHSRISPLASLCARARQNRTSPLLRRSSAHFRDQIMVDAMVFSPEGVRHLVEEIGPTQIVYGTDIPLLWPDAIDNILAAKIPDDQKEMILGGNLTKLLKL